jgi:hypothetical protein
MTKETEKRVQKGRYCLYCEKEFTPLRSTKKYCTGKCRSNHFNEKKMWEHCIATIIFEEKKKDNFFKKVVNLLRKSRIAYK